MKHIVTFSIVFFSLAQLASAQQCGPVLLRQDLAKQEALTNALIRVTVAVDQQENQVPALNTAVAAPVNYEVALSEKHWIAYFSFFKSASKESVKNNSP